MQKLRTKDPVKVITGKYKGTVSTIVDRDGDLVTVEGVNMYKRAKKGEWYKDITKPIHISNVMYYSSTHQSTSKIAISIDTNGKKQRKLTAFDEIIK